MCHHIHAIQVNSLVEASLVLDGTDTEICLINLGIEFSVCHKVCEISSDLTTTPLPITKIYHSPSQYCYLVILPVIACDQITCSSKNRAILRHEMKCGKEILEMMGMKENPSVKRRVQQKINCYCGFVTL